MSGKGDFQELLERGRTAEELVADILRKHGYYVIPSYEYSGRDDDKAPKLTGYDKHYTLPDLDVSGNGQRFWVEVKLKAEPTWTRKLQRYEHGIPLRHYQDYLQVERITGCPVYLAIVEEDTGLILFQSFRKLTECVRIYDGAKMSRGGMAFFPRDSFRILTRISVERSA